jgi:uncharacterized membrane protein required for colicin V production
MNWNLPFNFFDFALIALLAAGVMRGRKHGMSEELMGLLKWLIIVVACAFLYAPIGRWLADSSPISLLSCYVMVYISLALLVLGIFALLKHNLGGKLVGSDVFGRAEYYLGMGSGLVRFSCMILAVLALLNARYFTSAEVKERKDFQDEVYGKEYFPGLHSAQATVFEKSLTGPWIKDNLSFLLIEPTRPEKKELHQQEYALPH